ncbi:thioredoxin-like protein [Globomyces pollinis-pini]|nr:thioredoxin-like protein [Globomyces pollinis-pini]KAJ2996008.1 hypothetical protein HDV02_000237 [Globomyces sp. JEL0801]
MANPNEDTEWNDILREKGIIPEIKEEQIIEWIDEAIQEQQFKPLEKRDLDELDELEDDDLEDDRILEHYRKQRMDAIKSQLKAEIFGSVLEITKPDYQQQVTNASTTHWVVVNLYQTYISDSKLMTAILDRLATKYKATKFVKIKADMCIENYPDKNVPTLLVYGKGELQRQIVGLSTFGGKATTVENVEIFLKGLGALSGGQKVDDDEDEEERLEKFHINFHGKKQVVEDDDDDWD